MTAQPFTLPIKMRLIVFFFLSLFLVSCGNKEKGNYSKALAAIDSANYENAVQYLNTAIKEKEQDTTLAQLFFLRGQVYEKSGQLDLALNDYAEALKQNSENIEALVKAGNIYNLLSNYSDALKSYNRALEIDADNTDLLIKRADILTATDRDSLAFADFEKVISIEPENDYAIMSRALIYQRFKEPEKCCADLEKAASLGNETAAEFLHSMCGKQK
ncbi:MAG: Photosystem I assembly protein Ycf3 [Bacteroidia bacterium]|nr:Photosystem I assembly protein Ycf3 [Bacteroidia bacterium]